jgi:cell division protein FtsL
MARALRAQETRPASDPKSRSQSRQQSSSGGRATARQHSGIANPTRSATRTITTRTAKDRARQSPIARVVNRRDAPARLRRFVFVAVGIAVAAITLMMLVVVFQTRLAETQLGIDDIESQITAERNRYDQLRLERSILREPARLVTEAKALGMVPGSKTDFRTVDPLAVAAVLVSVGGMDPNSILGIKDPLERYGTVKAIIGDRR